MAIIGLYDADMIKYTHVLFNLDLMKLSTYYKNKNHGESYTNAYCQIINDILEKTYNGSFHHYPDSGQVFNEDRKSVV